TRGRRAHVRAASRLTVSLGARPMDGRAGMAGVLERIQGEIRERLEASRAAAEEYVRLEAALAALDRSDAGGDSGGARAARRQRLRLGPPIAPCARRSRAP